MNSIIKNRIEEINALCERLSVKQLWVFGSVNSPEFKSSSDIDFLVSFEKMKIEDYAENYFLLAENLEKVFNRDIDLVTLNSLSNPYFIEEVEKSRLIVYDRQDKKISA